MKSNEFCGDNFHPQLKFNKSYKVHLTVKMLNELCKIFKIVFFSPKMDPDQMVTVFFFSLLFAQSKQHF